jgi:sugar/nucleoside kinase (ribokinase family)
MFRKGIISAGNWLIDHLKVIDRLPDRGNLSNITAIAGNALGGCSHNVLVDLARLQTDLPLWAGGIVGDDSDGAFIMNEIRKYGIDSKYMSVRKGVTTSFTDVMSEVQTGARTFFHYRGANALLDYHDFLDMDTSAKIFHLGYLLLLDTLDSPDAEYGTVAARVLRLLKSKGYETSIDVVSEQGDRFRRIVTPSLKYVDYMICNEVEAGACAHIELRDATGLRRDKLPKVAEYLFEQGVAKLVVLHFPEGGFAMRPSGEQLSVASFKVSPSEIKSTVGAGDAFCAGALYAIHEGWSLSDMLTFANANARFNLLSESSTGGAAPLGEVKKYIDNH